MECISSGKEPGTQQQIGQGVESRATDGKGKQIGLAFGDGVGLMLCHECQKV